MYGQRNRKGCSRYISGLGWFLLICGIISPIGYYYTIDPAQTVQETIQSSAVLIITGLLLIIIPRGVAKLSRPPQINVEIVQTVDDVFAARSEQNVTSNGIGQSGENPVYQEIKGKELVVRCSGCGAANKVWAGETASCRYCGSPLKGE